MKEWLLRWAFVLVALLVVGPLLGAAIGWIPSVDSGGEATILVNRAPLLALLVALLVIAAAAGFGGVASRVVSPGTGLFVCGAALAWAAGSSGSVLGVLRVTREGGTLWRLSIEGLLIAVVGAGAAWLIWRAGDRPDKKDAPIDHPAVEISLGFVSALLAGALAAWVIAREGTKGQTIAAAMAAGLVGATVARVVAQRVHPAAVVGGVLALAALGPGVAALRSGGDAVAHAFSNRILELALLSPLDWLAGAMMGVPLGLLWAHSMVMKHTHKEASRAAA